MSPTLFPVSGGGSVCHSYIPLVWVVCESLWPFFNSLVKVVGRESLPALSCSYS